MRGTAQHEGGRNMYERMQTLEFRHYILAHDLGTSSNKASLFSTEGELAGSEVQGYPVHYFNGIWAEQDATDWWDAVCQTTQRLLWKTGISPG